jgi:hypothetical protein
LGSLQKLIIKRGLSRDSIEAYESVLSLWYWVIHVDNLFRVITVLLNFSSDERIGSEYIQLKALANSWLLDCARHNDLHKILQILTMMLANPATARVSIQYLSIKYRLTNHDIPSMPSDANCITLSTPNDKQHFYHICPDVDAHANKILTIDGNDEIHHHDLTKGYK